MTKWFSIVASVGGVLLGAVALVLNGCEGGDSAEVVTRNVGLVVEGFYRHTDANSFVVPRTSGQPIDSINLRQFGDQLQGIDNNGVVFDGTIGQIVSSNRASFNMEGRSTSGAPATIAGNIAVEGSTATMTGTYIEPTLVSMVFGVASVPTNPAPPEATNGVVTVSPTLVTLDPLGGTQTFNASGGQGNFTWTVSNPGLGNITQISGGRNASATYLATGLGNNTLTVRDETGESASATVQQTESGGEPPITPDPVTLSQTLVTIPPLGTASFTASGGVGTFRWSVGNFLGRITSISGSRNESAVYAAGNLSGQNTVTVTDEAGSRQTATIRQEQDAGIILPPFP